MLRTLTTIVCVVGILAAGATPARPVRAQADASREKQGGGKNPQKPKGGGGMKGKGKDKENLLPFSGTVRQVSPQALVVEADDGARYLINAAAESQVTLKGAAAETMLKPGAVVEFQMDFDRNGNPVRTVDAITFVEISMLNPMGLFRRAVPELGNAADENGRTAYLARGRLSSVRNGTIVLQTGGKPLLAKLAEEVAYAARFEHWAAAVEGDSVTGTIELLPQPNVGLTRVLADQITIEAAAPIEPPGAKRPVPKSKSTTDAKSANDSRPASDSN